MGRVYGSRRWPDRVPCRDIRHIAMAARERLQLTQVEFGWHMGVSTSVVQRWEKGDGTIDKRILAELRKTAHV
jgi:DNA-binding transcriptional regulator YiaG